VINQGGVVDASTSQPYVYVNTSGTLSIYGLWLDADGNDLHPVISVDDSANIQLATPNYVGDQQINVPYTITTGATPGSHSLRVSTMYGQSNPGTFKVGPAVQVTPGPTTIMGFTTGPDTRAPVANCVAIQANAQPSGGSFSWSTASSAVSLQNANTSQVTVCSVSGGYSRQAGDVAVSVVYTVNGVSSKTGTTTLTVSRPQVLLSPYYDNVSPTGHKCVQGSGQLLQQFLHDQSYYNDSLLGATYQSYVRDRDYHVQDQLSNTVSYSMNVFESYTPARQVSTGIGAGVNVTDFFAYCSQTCRQGGTDSVNANQSIYANNYLIGTKAVTWTCTSATVSP
jgi:hypothetical protein